MGILLPFELTTWMESAELSALLLYLLAEFYQPIWGDGMRRSD